MSSITASDRASSQDEIRRLREEYDQQEAESAKRKSREVRSLNEKYEKELDGVRDDFNNQLSTVREKNHETLDERDRRHAEDVSKIRDMYLESLKRKSTDDDRERIASKNSYESELTKQKEISRSQSMETDRNFQNTLKERDRSESDFNRRAISEMQDGLRERVDKLNEHHERETRAITEDRDRMAGDLKQRLLDTKALAQDRELSESREHRGELDRRTKSFEKILGNQEHNMDYQLQTRDKVMQEEIGHLRQKAADRLAENDEKMKEIREHYAEEMDGREGGAAARAKADMIQARSELALDSSTNNRMREVDHNHLQRAYQEREENLNRQLEETNHVANQQAQEKIDRVLDRTQKVMKDANWRTRLDKDIDNMRNKEALQQSEIIGKDRLQAANSRADSRVQKVVKSTNQAEQEEIRQHEENIDALRRNYGNNLQDQREANLDTMKSIYSRMDQRVRDLEATWMKKHDDMVDFYENKIADLDNQRRVDLQKMAQTYEARGVQREKAVKVEEEGLTQKYEQKMAIQEDIHRKELDRLERRHQEQMASLASRTAAQVQAERKA